MTEERMLRTTWKQWSNLQLLTKEKVGLPEWSELEHAPPKDWQERLHKVAELTAFISETGDGTEAGFNSIDAAISRLKDVATLKQQIVELENANRYLSRSNGKLILELRQKSENRQE